MEMDIGTNKALCTEMRGDSRKSFHIGIEFRVFKKRVKSCKQVQHAVTQKLYHSYVATSLVHICYIAKAHATCPI